MNYFFLHSSVPNFRLNVERFWRIFALHPEVGTLTETESKGLFLEGMFRANACFWAKANQLKTGNEQMQMLLGIGDSIRMSSGAEGTKLAA